MLRLLSDIAPIPEIYERVPVRVVTDTVDTVAGAVQPLSNGVSGGSHTLPWIFGAIAAALIALGFCLFMVRSIRQRGEQQLGFTPAQS